MPESSSNSTPQRNEIGGFHIIEKIGEGGMGIVYRARQASLNRTVALKILSPRLTEDITYVDRFRKESLAAAALHHPNLIAVFDAGEIDGLKYYAMEFVEGETLHQWLAREGRLPERTALEIASCAASALKYAWDKAQLIHRDVKPANIMVDTDGNVKVCDLGLAKTFGENTLLSIGGYALGTPHYASPEQARGEPDVDQRSDIYSLGMTLHHMLTGDIPFPGATAAAVMAKQLTDQLPDPREYNPEISAGACRLLEKMLAKDARDRYLNWEEVLGDMRRVSDGEMPSASPPPSNKTSLHRNPQFDVRLAAAQRSFSSAAAISQRQSSKWSLILGGIGALIVSGLALFMIFNSSDSSQNSPPPPRSSKSQNQKADELLRKAEEFLAANPSQTVDIAERLREVITQYSQTPAAGVARDRLAQFADLSLSAASEFAQANPGQSDEIVRRFREVASVFRGTEAAVRAEVQIERWTLSRELDPEQRLKKVEEFAANFPGSIDEILLQLGRLAEEYKGTPSGDRARQLLNEWSEKKRAIEEKRREEEARRAAEQQRLEEEARLRAEQQALSETAQLKADARFIEFGCAFLKTIRQRNYAEAAQQAQTALADEALTPLKDRVAMCHGAAQQLAQFWSALRKDVSTLKGQVVTLQGTRGKVDDVTENDIALEKTPGATLAIATQSLTFDEWMMLAARIYGKPEAEMLVRFAWFSFAEGKSDRINGYLEQAQAKGIRTESVSAAMAALSSVSVEQKAVEALADLRQLADKQQWQAARQRLDSIRTELAASAVIRAAQKELEQLESRIAEGDLQASEAAAVQLLADLKSSVTLKQWKTANEQYTRLTSRYGGTKAVADAAKELAPLKEAIDLATGQVARPDEDKERRDMVQRRGGRILIVNGAAERAGQGPRGEPLYVSLAQAISEAQKGDGIEIWDGVYSVSLDKVPKDILVYGKAGAMPVISSNKPGDWTPKLFQLEGPLQLENLCLVTDQQNLVFFRVNPDSSASMKLRSCALIGGGPTSVADGNRNTLEMEDCLVLNFQRMVEFGRTSRLRLSSCTLVNFRFLSNVFDGGAVVMNLTLQNSVLAGGLIAKEWPPDASPWGAKWTGVKKPWRDWVRERSAASPLKTRVTYTGDRNFIANPKAALVYVPQDDLAYLIDWRKLYFSQDLNSVALDARNPVDIFANAAQGDFRLRLDTAGAKLASDGGPLGVRWPLWRWKSFLEKWKQQDLKLAEKGG